MSRFSVIVPCYNHSKYLLQAVDSALSQSGADVEVVVIDDGSTDATPQVASKYGNQIKYIRTENRGLPAARNAGIAASSGEFVSFLDADDYLHPNALAASYAAFSAEGKLDVAYGDGELVDRDGGFIQRLETLSPPQDVFHWLLAGNRWSCQLAVVRRALLEAAKLFDVTLRACEDWDLWIRCAAAGGRFGKIHAVIGSYRRYDGSMSTNPRRLWSNGLKVLKKNAHHHRNCHRCGEAIRMGRRWLRGYCVQGIGEFVLRRGWAGTGSIAGTLLRHPSMIPPVTYDTAWRLRDRLLGRGHA